MRGIPEALGRFCEHSRLAATLLALVAMVAVASGCGDPPPSQSSGESAGGTTAETTTGETTSETTAVEVGESPELDEATDAYEEYVVEQVDLLEERTKGFTDAVLAGDVQEAKRLFGPTREPWERIEPIAGALGDYDPDIDAREGDVPREEWSGFHRIEKALWVKNTTKGQAQYARELMQDVSNLREDVEDLELEPVDLVIGSVELLNEVSAGKITGEEDRYSHTDLYDIQANVEGSEAAFEELKPEIAGEDLALANDIEEGFDQVYEELDQYRRGDGWVSYERLGEAERRSLSQKVDALAEPLSRAGKVLEEG